MFEPKLLSPEELERHLVEGAMSEHVLRAHIAALEADNAALLNTLSFSIRNGCGCGWSGDEPDAHKPEAQCPVRDVQMAPHHPGATLLETHAKALIRARNEGLEKAASALSDDDVRRAVRHAPEGVHNAMALLASIAKEAE